MNAADETPVAEGAYDAACAILAKYVDGYGEVRGLTAYQAGIRAVDAAAPLIAAEAEKRGAVTALALIEAQYGDERAGELTVRGNVQMAAHDLARRIESGEVTLP
jgi:hypothetical protein